MLVAVVHAIGWGPGAAADGRAGAQRRAVAVAARRRRRQRRWRRRRPHGLLPRRQTGHRCACARVATVAYRLRSAIDAVRVQRRPAPLWTITRTPCSMSSLPAPSSWYVALYFSTNTGDHQRVFARNQMRIRNPLGTSVALRTFPASLTCLFQLGNVSQHRVRRRVKNCPVARCPRANSGCAAASSRRSSTGAWLFVLGTLTACVLACGGRLYVCKLAAVFGSGGGGGDGKQQVQRLLNLQQVERSEWKAVRDQQCGHCSPHE